MKKIIYVEDDEDTAAVVKLIIEKAGHKVEIALCGKDAVGKIREKDYDLALLDIMLPDISGWEVYEQVKDKKMKFAVISALPVTNRKREELMKSGISDYIIKPFTKKDLIKRIKSIL